MAEQIISPGVFTRENDLSFLPQGVGAIGAAIVGPTVKGPAFVPTVVKSFAEYERRFGGLSKETFVPQTVREYLRNAGSVTVCRVLAGGGYTFADGVNEPIAVIGGNETSVGQFATCSLTINNLPNNAIVADGSPDRIQIANDDDSGFIDFIFVPNVDNYPNTDTAFYVDFDATANNAATNLMGAINELATASLSKITASVDISGDNPVVSISGSSVGAQGNRTIQSGSGGGASTFLLPVEAATGALGGADSVAANQTLLGLIYPSKAVGIAPSLQDTEIINTDLDPSITGSFTLSLKGRNISEDDSVRNIKASVNPSDNDGYLFSILGDTPDNSRSSVIEYRGTPGYSYLNFKSLQTDVQSQDSLNSPSGLGSGSIVKLSYLDSNVSFSGGSDYGAEGYSYASTPFIKSQLSDNKELFRFHSIGHGEVCNTDYKISITNLREPADIDGEEQYSTFSVLIRKYSDTDSSPLIVEQYNNVNLDPDSANYIARVIGDRYPQYNDTLGKVELLGNYPNVSQYCRVEVSDIVAAKATSPKLSPKGFEAVTNPIPTASFTEQFVIPSSSYEGVQQIGGNYSNRGFLGWKFDEKELDNKNFLKPLPKTIEKNVAGDFNVENYSGHPSASFTGSLSASIDSTGVTGPTADQLKFTVCFQGGFDGIAPYQVKFVGNESTLAGEYSTGENLYGFDMSNNAPGSNGYKKALNILSNQDEYDINMVALPGIIHQIPGHSIIANAAVDMCEERGDAFYVMDLAQYNQSVNQAVNAVSGLDTNYAAVYYPWVKVNGPSGIPVLVPPSVIVPGAIAASDRIAAEWFAPAGLNRGVLGNVIEAKMRLNQAERDRLYNAKINPIATFPQTGVCIWGQKTLQERPTALDRINVRRLLIALKKFIASSSRYLVFEQNTNATRNRFLNIVNPYLESVQQRQGLYSFRVQMDEANNTADVVDRNQLVGAIYLQPTKTAEFIILDFNVLPTGATFDGGGSAGGTGGGGY